MAEDNMHDIELQPLGPSEVNRTPSTSRSSSSDSAASRLLTEVNTVGQQSPTYADFEEEPSFKALRPGRKLKKLVIAVIAIVVFILYTAWLLSYRGKDTVGGHKTQDKSADNDGNASLESSLVESSSTSITDSLPSTVTSSSDPLDDLLNSLLTQVSPSSSGDAIATSTKELISLTELPVRPKRDTIQQIKYSQTFLKDTPDFVGTPKSKADDEGVYLIKQDDRFLLRSVSDEKYVKVIFKGDKLSYNGHDHAVSSVMPSADGSKALMFSEEGAVFRHSIRTHCYLLDVESQELIPITSGVSSSKLSHVAWSKTFKYVSFVQDGDLYIMDVSKGKIDRITADGSEDISNARTDWVYEEEVLFTDVGLWWDDDDSTLAFLKFNETGVDELMLEKYDDGVFPTIEKIKYPKPGRKNPEVTLWTYDLQKSALNEVDRSDSKHGAEWVCYGGLWINGSLVIRETDRESKKLDYRLVKAGVSKITTSIDSNEYDGWIENFNKMIPIPNNEAMNITNDGFVDIVQFENFNHIGYFQSLDSPTPIMLTSGDWEVISIFLFDKSANLLYFTANRQSHFEQHLFAVDIISKEMYSISDISASGFHMPSFSPSGRFIADYNIGPTFPTLILMDTISKTDTKKMEEKRSVDFTNSRRSYHTVTLADGETVDIIEMVPERFDRSKPHPLLVNIYGGPGFRKLDVRLHASFEDSVSDDLNAVILYIDPRGTGGQGWKYRSYAKRHIGHWEPRDIIEVTKLWIDSRNYIDESKVSIWGWSYGGFTTLKTLEVDGGNVFKYGIAVAPVTDWRLYDSIYTERYMDQPNDNEDGYKESRISNVENLKGVERFAIMHGTGDDNVHIQNTFKLLDLLNVHSVTNFDLMVFPDSNHNINYHNAYSMLMSRLREWLKTHVV